MNAFTFTADDEADTQAIGAALADLLPARAVIALDGPLGAGKTRFVQALAEASGVDRRDVVSPTFVLAHHYHGRRTIYHLDAYRVAGEEEFLDLGVEEYFADEALTVIEWADRVAGVLPAGRIALRIDVLGPTSRRFTFTAPDEHFPGLLVGLAGRMKLHERRSGD